MVAKWEETTVITARLATAWSQPYMLFRSVCLRLSNSRRLACNHTRLRITPFMSRILPRPVNVVRSRRDFADDVNHWLWIRLNSVVVKGGLGCRCLGVMPAFVTVGQRFTRLPRRSQSSIRTTRWSVSRNATSIIALLFALAIFAIFWHWYLFIIEIVHEVYLV